jgi:hypothetical protein
VDGTYKKYKAVWKKLLSYVYRLTVTGQGPNLHYTLTPQQQQALADLPATITANLPSAAAHRCSVQATNLACSPILPSKTPIRPRRQQKQLQTPTTSAHISNRGVSGNADGLYDEESGSEYTPLLSPALPSSLPPQLAPIQDGHQAEQCNTADSTPQEQTTCLQLCISLLDHQLQGRITDSIVVGFLAANGINKECTGFDEAVVATSPLSALVKMAQMLLLQYSAYEYEAGRTDFPGELVAHMQDRFMVFGSNSPMNWILNLRAYGTVIRNNTTAAGWIEWSDDGEKLSYKALELTINGLRWAVRDQITEAQKQLNQLLLLPDAEPDTRARLVPVVRLAGLKDDPGVFTAGHSFLTDPRNQAALGNISNRYMLNKIRDDGSLRQRFFSNQKALTWNLPAVQQYIRLTYQFLERLLLLVHITGGQPARGTELLTLRWRNSSHSDIRSIFMDNGMLCFVTSYHKNYSISSTCRIIHRYVPAEVGEILLYYLWLVTPFLDALCILTEGGLWEAPDIGSYLWPASLYAAARSKNIRICGKGKNQKVSGGGRLTSSKADSAEDSSHPEQPWPSTHLGHVIQTLLAAALGTTITILLWRHAAIAMSRKHLPEECRFKRDYSLSEGDTAMDLQAAHSSARASISYARRRDEGPGFSPWLRDDYRRVSRHWHTFLGFGTVLPPRDGVGAAPQEEAAFDPEPLVRKRKRADLEKELRTWVSSERLLRSRGSRRQRSSSTTAPRRDDDSPSRWDF